MNWQRKWLRLFGACLVAIVSWASAFAEDVPWLAEATTPRIPDDAPKLISVLRDESGQKITTLADWKKQRQQLHADWAEFLGLFPQSKAPLQIEQISSERLEHCTRILIRYQVEPGRMVRAYVLKPHAATDERLPAVVAFHGTSPTTFQKLVGLDGEAERHMGLRLAQAGFVVICPENYLWEEKSYLASVERVLSLHPGSKGMAVMLMDGKRAVDVLESLTYVDPQRIGTYGHSLGAKEAMYLAAFDERVCAAVASEGGVGLTFTNWDAPWYLGKEIRQEGFSHDHHEIVALIAPKPFLVLAGEQGRGCADGDRTWPYIVVGQQVTGLYEKPNRMALWNHGQGHRLSPESGDKVIEWLLAYTK